MAQNKSLFEKKKSKYLGSAITGKKNKSKNGVDDTISWKDQQKFDVSNSSEKEVLKYEGEVDPEGKYNGIGRLSNTQTGEFYEGQWINGMREGFGAQLFPTGERYQGAWKSDKMDGPGVVSYPNGDTLQGVWENGKRISGTFQFAKGVTIFKEKWTHDVPGPRGQLDYNTGGRYLGEVGYNQEGRYTVKDYVIFRQGYGEMFWSNGNKYIGYWKTDKRKGYGVLLEYSGPKYYGTWTRGKKSGYGIEIFLDGTYYEGSYMHDERKGKGKVVLPNGDVVLGEWNKSNVTNATYYHGAFNDVPRPLRAIFLENVTAIQKTEDKSLFTSTEKWGGFVHEGLEGVNFESLDLEKVFMYLSAADKTKGLKPTPFSKLIDMFVNVFTWEYEGVKGQSKKETTYSLQTAVDDAHSFLACLSHNISQRISLDYKQNKALYEVLMVIVFSRIYHTLFPLYQQVYKSMDAKLKAKFNELKGVTTALIGVKLRFHLDPSKKGLKEHTGGKTGNPTSETEGTTNAFRMMMTTPPPPLPATPSPSSSKSPMATPESGPAMKVTALDAELDGRGAEDSSDSSESQEDNIAEDENLSEKESEISGSESALARPEGGGMSVSGDSESISDVEGKKSKTSRKTPKLGNSKNGTPFITTSTATTSTTSTAAVLPIKKEQWAQKRFSMTVQNPLLPQQPILQQPRLNSGGNFISSSPPSSGLTPPRPSNLPRVEDDSSQKSPRNATTTNTKQQSTTTGTGPYQKVVDSLSRISNALNPIDKLQCITTASNSILSCVDEFYTDKTENILMGAEDKFPVLIYALIRANIPDLWCHCFLIQDFLSEHLGDEESKYRASELTDALKYIQSLDWHLRDKQDILIPLKMIISSVGWAAKGVERLKFPERADPENEKFEILISLSDIFRAISQRRSDIYSPYRIPAKISKTILRCENFFMQCIEAKDLGLKLRKETSSTGGVVYFIDFDLKHPVYVYQKLSETCVVLEAE